MDNNRFKEIKETVDAITEWNSTYIMFDRIRNAMHPNKAVTMDIITNGVAAGICFNHEGIYNATEEYLELCMNIIKSIITDLQKRLEELKFGKWVCQKCGHKLRAAEHIEEIHDVDEDGTFDIGNKDNDFRGTRVYCPVCLIVSPYQVNWSDCIGDRYGLRDENNCTAIEMYRKVKQNA